MYDRKLTLYALDSGTPLQSELTPISEHLYTEIEVYAKRYWDSIQAGTSVDMLVDVLLHLVLDTSTYCIPDDGKVYRVIQVQHRLDGDELPITRLSLHRETMHYEIARADK